ncbi:MAG: hypothetical protein D6788_04415 [Planctomycetota bacterium]|nr:MAG: hypothetical protein D6788_04415 [Planctomycetota bacterium]
MAGIGKALLAKLRCPASGAPLVAHEGFLYAVDPEGRRRYPVRDGIPVLLIEASERVEPSEFERVMAEVGERTPTLEGRH